MATSVRDRVQADLRAALSERDTSTVATLRIALGALANAEAVPLDEVAADRTEAPRREVADEEARALLEAEIGELEASALLLTEHGQPARAAELAVQADVLRRYL
jgi:uncharacterized protein